MTRTDCAPGEELLAGLVTALEHPGYAIRDQALPDDLAAALAGECRDLDSHDFHAAGTGRQQGHQHDARVRSDEIRWLDATTPASKAYLDFMESLRGTLNSRLFLGLFDYECHYARYAPGAYYRKHLDAFAGNQNRVLSTVFYLNETWSEELGGELQLYSANNGIVLASVAPVHNRLVVFLSERFPHEVLPAARERHSIAGWFRVRQFTA